MVDFPKSAATEEADRSAAPDDSNAALDGEVGDELEVGATKAGLSVNVALRALSKAARSFAIYESHSRLIRQFLTEYRDGIKAAFEICGDIELEVRPFEMVLKGEVVYLERDRERSLAFRMFRDGVRLLVIQKEAAWEELATFLEIVATRVVGSRQQEDDIVTLLWKSGVQHVVVRAVEGFEPEDDDEGKVHGRERDKRRSAVRIEAPQDWDLPLPPLDEASTVRYRPIHPALLAVLHAEEGPDMTPVAAARLAAAMISVAADATDPTTLADILPFIAETRDYLLEEGQAGPLAMMVRELIGACGEQVDQVAAVLGTFADEQSMRLLLRAVPDDANRPPTELCELLDLIPGDHLGQLIDLLESERGRTSGRVALLLLERYAPRRPSYVTSRIRASEPGVVTDLLGVIKKVLPAQAVEAAMLAAEVPDREVQVAVLALLEVSSDSDASARTAIRMLDSESPEVRIHAARLLALVRPSGAFEALVAQVEKNAARGMNSGEAEAMGVALARIAADQAAAAFSEWIRPRGLLGRFVETPGHKMLRWAAVSGLEGMPGDESEQLIRWLAERAGEDLHRHCMTTLVRRRAAISGRA